MNLIKLKAIFVVPILVIGVSGCSTETKPDKVDGTVLFEPALNEKTISTETDSIAPSDKQAAPNNKPKKIVSAQADDDKKIDELFGLGFKYSTSQSSSQRDYKKAVDSYLVAANKGHAGAQNNLGIMYKNGNGVLRDYEQSVFWFRKAAEQGVAKSQYNLGVMYDNGQGVKQNHKEAAYWYRKASEKGYASAQNNLGVMYQLGQGVQQNYTQAAFWYRKAASRGDANAKENLSSMKSTGLIK
jgi:hypothetical protein